MFPIRYDPFMRSRSNFLIVEHGIETLAIRFIRMSLGPGGMPPAVVVHFLMECFCRRDVFVSVTLRFHGRSSFRHRIAMKARYLTLFYSFAFKLRNALLYTRPLPHLFRLKTSFRGDGTRSDTNMFPLVCLHFSAKFSILLLIVIIL